MQIVAFKNANCRKQRYKCCNSTSGDLLTFICPTENIRRNTPISFLINSWFALAICHVNFGIFCVILRILLAGYCLSTKWNFKISSKIFAESMTPYHWTMGIYSYIFDKLMLYLARILDIMLRLCESVSEIRTFIKK